LTSKEFLGYNARQTTKKMVAAINHFGCRQHHGQKQGGLLMLFTLGRTKN
jgi:hypothetical protein